MAVKPDDLPWLLERVYSGDEAATAVLLEHFEPTVRCAVRRLLNEKLRSKYDSLDFVQDVWLAFLKTGPDNALGDAKGLAGFLKVLARNKVLEKARQCLEGQSRNVNCEFSLDSPYIVADEFLDANQPTPSEVVTGEEEMEQYLCTLPPVYRAVVELTWEGCDVSEIAERLGLKVRRVYRIIERCMKRKNPWL